MHATKILAALAVCALLFWLGLRLARRAIDAGIARGREAERERVGEGGEICGPCGAGEPSANPYPGPGPSNPVP
ncbi:hypothetical protein [Methylobacterium segetis]|uniref:hypothetical protein n=1 Tax=Methylobacterium segetis TaxID=2488750 RepID=UPI001049003C|nr:hypothetical protein [Methylobacterium segetis]